MADQFQIVISGSEQLTSCCMYTYIHTPHTYIHTISNEATCDVICPLTGLVPGGKTTVGMVNRKKFTSSSLTDPAVVIELIYY